jgi:hypothetical protein
MSLVLPYGSHVFAGLSALFDAAVAPLLGASGRSKHSPGTRMVRTDPSWVHFPL